MNTFKVSGLERDLDLVTREIWLAIIRDLRPELWDRARETRTFPELREVTSSIYLDDDPYSFKKGYQVRSLMKRYIHHDDGFCYDKLMISQSEKFRNNQSRLQSYNVNNISGGYRDVLLYAKGWLDNVLGPFDTFEFLQQCHFGRKSSVGIPMRLACEAERLEWPISGSIDEVHWFEGYLNHFNHTMSDYFHNVVKPKGDVSPFRIVDTLDMTLVPKKFDSLRGITKNTTIGSFRSDGLGRMLSRRLRNAGYDIETLQFRHRRLAQIASETQEWVTCDQSDASDNINYSLVEFLFPSEWFKNLTVGRIARVRTPDGVGCDLSTFATMGMGFTFPLQTLVFLSLLHGIRIYLDLDDVLISAYGDDLIFDKRMWTFVKHFFPKLGLVINNDKTFFEGNFRESCGGDYFHGVDVRPWQLPENGGTRVLTAWEYQAFLYLSWNSILKRWTPWEVPHTLEYISKELATNSTYVHVVPDSFPDCSGIHQEFHEHVTGGIFCETSKKSSGGPTSVKYLRFIPRLTEESRHWPYLSRSLQGSSQPSYERHRSGLNDYIRSHLGDGQQIFITRKVTEKGRPVYLWSSLHHKKIRKTATYIALTGSKGRYQESSAVTWL